jgi:hypothetical protein
MRYIRLAYVIALVIFSGLSLLIATSDDSLESFDPYHPATLLPIVAKRLHTLGSQVTQLLDSAAAAFRERIRHESATEFLPQ